MIQIERVLCPVDSSWFSARALRYASALAEWYGAGLTALSVLPNTMLGAETSGARSLDDREIARRGEEAVRAFVFEAIGSSNARVITTTGLIVDEILAVATSWPADLIVMGTHGSSGFDHLLLGSVTEKILRKAACPVLTVPRLANLDAPQSVAVQTIVCAVDFSEASTRALDYALSLAKEAGGRLVLLHVLEWFAEAEPMLTGHFNVPEFRHALEADARRQLAARLPEVARSSGDVCVVVGFGKAYREVLRVAAEESTDLIVLGVRGRGAVDLTLFGSTANHVVRKATCPVLTVGTGTRASGATERG